MCNCVSDRAVGGNPSSPYLPSRSSFVPAKPAVARAFGALHTLFWIDLFISTKFVVFVFKDSFELFPEDG